MVVWVRVGQPLVWWCGCSGNQARRRQCVAASQAMWVLQRPGWRRRRTAAAAAIAGKVAHGKAEHAADGSHPADLDVFLEAGGGVVEARHARNVPDVIVRGEEKRHVIGKAVGKDVQLLGQNGIDGADVGGDELLRGCKQAGVHARGGACAWGCMREGERAGVGAHGGQVC